VLDEDAVKTLVEPAGQIELFAAPHRAEPVLGHQKQHHLAAVGRFIELAFPTLPGGDTAFRAEIEKNLVLPAFALQPIEQHDGRVAVRARMAYEDARFSAVQQRRSPTGRAALSAPTPRILPRIRPGIRTAASAALSGRARDFFGKSGVSSRWTFSNNRP